MPKIELYCQKAIIAPENGGEFEIIATMSDDDIERLIQTIYDVCPDKIVDIIGHENLIDQIDNKDIVGYIPADDLLCYMA